MTESKLVYLASPYAGDVQENVKTARRACRYAMEQGVTPIAVHLIYPQFLNDGLPEEREMGIQMGLRVLKACDELWVFGDHISAGMQRELEEAKRLGIPVKEINSQELNHNLKPNMQFSGMRFGGC